LLVDAHYRVLSVTRATGDVANDFFVLTDGDGSLREEIRSLVGTLIARCDSPREHDRIAFIDDSRFIRLMTLEGSAGRMFALTLEYDRRRDSLARAARRYALTKRETQVLGHILQGASTNEVAAALNLAETTVQGYFKRLLGKTQARNRAAMVAAVCDWEGAR